MTGFVDARPDIGLWRARTVVALLYGVLAAALGTGVALGSDRLVVLVALAFVGWPLLLSSWGRLCIYVFGGMLTFSTGGVGPIKVGYTGASLLFARVGSGRMDPRLQLAVVLLGIPVVLGVVVGAGKASQITYVARDAVTYLLPLAAVYIGASYRSRSSVGRPIIIVAASAISAGLFAMNILINRGELAGADRIAAGSMLVVLVGVCWAIGLAQRPGLGWVHRSVAVLFVASLIGMVLASGTRTGLVLCIPVLAAAAVSFVRRPGAATASLVGVAAVLSWIIVAVLPLFLSRDFLSRRLLVTRSVFGGGLAQDESAADRFSAWSRGLDYFRDSPVIGQGFGVVVPDGGNQLSGFYLDAPSLYLAKFGLVGALLLFLGYVILLNGVLRISRDSQRITIWLFALGFLCILPFGAPSEDKGFGWAIALLLMIALKDDELEPSSTTSEGTT